MDDGGEMTRLALTLITVTGIEGFPDKENVLQHLIDVFRL